MAAPSYTTDLTEAGKTLSTCDATTGWAKITATNWTAGGATVLSETEFPIQGSACNGCTYTKTGVGGMLYNNGAGFTIPADGAVLVWGTFLDPAAIDIEANGGMRVCIGSDLNNFYAVKALGRDKAPYPYGGWVCLAMGNPSEITPDYTVGSPTSTRQYAGFAVSVTTAIGKGDPFGVDAIRYGRCDARFVSGDQANGYATFAGFAAVNDASSARWGLIQAVSGGYLWQGLMTLGYGGAVDFRDANTMVLVARTQKVTANFNKIEIRNASSRVDWTSISFLALGTVSKGRLEVVDDCDVNLSGCTFTDMDTFIFKAASDVLNCVFRRCNTITANDAKFAGTLFDVPSVAADTSQLVWDVNSNPITDLSGCTFTKGALAHHAIEFGTNSPTAITLTNMTFTGFNAADGQNDSAIHLKRTSGTVTITLSGTNQPSIKKDANLTVEWVSSSRTVKVAVGSIGGPVTGANVMLMAAAGGPFPANASVTIARSGTTATVTHTAHGIKTNDVVLISGITDKIEDNCPHTITKTGDNTYTYPTTDSGSTNYTGSIKSTFVFLKGIADGGTNGNEISMSREIPSTQPITGWARKSTSAPYYKQGAISGSVSATGDTTFSPVLIADD